MNEMEEQDSKSSIASDFSILPEASEVEAMSLAQPFLAARASKNSASGSYNNQVEFVNVCSNYPATQDLLLYFRFTADQSPVVTDRLAIYRVGFTSPQHYLVYEWAPRQALAAPPAHLTQEGQQQAPTYAITFKKASLPNEPSEFFQVCYVSDGQKIRGVSPPFQLMQDDDASSSHVGSSNDVVIAYEQADGSILISSDVSMLHNNIKMLQESVQQVRAEKECVEKELSDVQTQMQGKQDKLEDLEEKILDLKAKAECASELSTSEMAAVLAKLQKVESERNGLQEMLHHAREQVCLLQEEQTRQQEHEQQLNDTLLQQEAQVKEAEEACKVQKQDLENTNIRLGALVEKQELLMKELCECTEQRDDARQQVKYWTEASSADKSTVHQLQDQCHSANEEVQRQLDAIQAEQERADNAEDQNRAIMTELETERAALAALNTSLKDCQEQLSESEERRKVLDADNRSLQDNLHTLQTFVEDLQEQLRVSCSARDGAERVAEQLSSRQQEVERERTVLEAKNNKLASKCSKLTKLVLEQNVNESVEALVGLHDEDSTVGDEDDYDVARQNAVLATAASSVAAIELSGSVDSRMSLMMEEMLMHMRQLKTIVKIGTGGQSAALGQATDGATTDELDTSVVAADQAGAEEAVVKETDAEEDASSGATVRDVEVDTDATQLEQRIKVETAIAAAESVVEACIDHARLQQELKEENVDVDPIAVATADAEAAAEEVLEQQVDEEAEVFVDAPTRPSSTVINMESVPPKQTVEHEALQQENGLQENEPEPMQATQPEKIATEPVQEDLPTPEPAAQPRLDHRCYYGPVFTAGQTAPVFFPQRPDHSRDPSDDPNAAGGLGYPPFMLPTPMGLPYPPIYPMPLTAGNFHSCPPVWGPMGPPPPPPFQMMPPPPPAAPQASAGLPPPLLPEKTEGARHAALLSTISAAAAQAIHNITSGLTPPATDAAPSSGPASEEETTAPAAAAAATASSLDGAESTDTTSDGNTTTSGHTTTGLPGVHIKNEGAPVSRESGFSHSNEFVQRMNEMRERFNDQRLAQHQACQMTQQAAQQQRMHMRAHQELLRSRRLRDLERHQKRWYAAAEAAAAAASTAASTSTSSSIAASVAAASSSIATSAAAVASNIATTVSSFASPAVVATSITTATETRASDVEEEDSSQQPAQGAHSPDGDDGYLHCPMCPLKFGQSSSGLYAIHVESHLELICPICNTGYQKSQEEQFNAHVNTHFEDEAHMMPSAPNQDDDPSGPWARICSMSGFMETD